MSNITGINQYTYKNVFNMPLTTDINNFIPTPSEQKLLLVICNPNNLGKTVTDICCEANVDRGVYYDAMKKEGFAELKNKIVIDSIKKNISDVLLATVKFAVSNAKNTADRKMLLEMAGLYTNKQDLTINSTSIALTDEEIDERLANLLKNSNKI